MRPQFDDVSPAHPAGNHSRSTRSPAGIRLTALVALTAAATLLTGCAAVTAGDKSPASEIRTESAANPAAWEPNLPAWEGLPSRPVSPDEYAATFMQANPNNPQHRTLDGILDYYTEAAIAFPFPLPEGYAFPVDPGYYDRPEDGPNWSEIVTANRIFWYWEFANVDAARTALSRGDDEAATAYFDVIRDGYLSVTFPNNYADLPASEWYDNVYGPMREGDFADYEHLVFNPFPWQPPATTP